MNDAPARPSKRIRRTVKRELHPDASPNFVAEMSDNWYYGGPDEEEGEPAILVDQDEHVQMPAGDLVH